MAGVHGDEVEGIQFLQQFLSSDLWPSLEGLDLWCMPCANPDGEALGQRCNGRGVDLNRNLPTQDWTAQILNPRYPPGSAPGSELETQYLVCLVETLQPRAIFSIHSAFTDRCININGSHALILATAMSHHSGYPITDDIGYPTPGSLGTWAGKERGIPTLTLEIPRGQDPGLTWQEHGIALAAGIQAITHILTP